MITTLEKCCEERQERGHQYGLEIVSEEPYRGFRLRKHWGYVSEDRPSIRHFIVCASPTSEIDNADEARDAVSTRAWNSKYELVYPANPQKLSTVQGPCICHPHENSVIISALIEELVYEDSTRVLKEGVDAYLASKRLV